MVGLPLSSCSGAQFMSFVLILSRCYHRITEIYAVFVEGGVPAQKYGSSNDIEAFCFLETKISKYLEWV